MMSDLRESGAIEQDADIIGFLYREDYYNKDKEPTHDSMLQQTDFIVSKHRNGSVGVVELGFNLSKGKFTDRTK
jgi:replicative DNA helicase